MDNQLNKAQICQAIDTSLSGLENDPHLARKVLQQVHAAQSKARQKKPIAVLVLALLLILISALGSAIGIALHTMTSRVAQMDANGQMTAWGLHEKLTFVQAMRDSGFDIKETDWQTLTNPSIDNAAREAAADRIVYARYGSVQEEQNTLRPVPSDSVMGDAPDAVLIFRERYLAEHPDADEYDYLDALGYWLRDEYWPQYSASLSPQQSPIPKAANLLTQEMIEQDMMDYLTEVTSLSSSQAQSATITSSQDKSSGAWSVCAVFPILPNTLPDENPWITKEGNNYQLNYWVLCADNGDWCRAQTLDDLLTLISETNRRIALHTINPDEAETLALRAIQNKYNLSYAEIKRYFVYNADTYWNDPDCIRLGILLRTRNNNGAPWDYAAIVNLTTAKVDDLFTAEDLFAKLPQLAEALPYLQEDEEFLNYLRWYTTWSPFGSFDQWPSDKQEFASPYLAEIEKYLLYSLRTHP